MNKDHLDKMLEDHEKSKKKASILKEKKCKKAVPFRILGCILIISSFVFLPSGGFIGLAILSIGIIILTISAFLCPKDISTIG